LIFSASSIPPIALAAVSELFSPNVGRNPPLDPSVILLVKLFNYLLLRCG
jgi:hypothetical protein